MISNLLGYGITDTHIVYDSDGLALYFKVYLTDIEYPGETDEEPKISKDIVEKVEDDNGYVIEETTNVGSILTVNGMSMVRPGSFDEETDDSKQFLTPNRDKRNSRIGNRPKWTCCCKDHIWK